MSRSDDPTYRKGMWPNGKVAGAHNRCREYVPPVSEAVKPKRVRKPRAKKVAA